MSEQIFTVYGIAKGQGRPRFARIGNHVRAYDPKESRDHKANIAAQVIAQHPRLINKGVPVLLHVQAYLPRPKVHYRANGELKPTAPGYCATKPDADNIIKGLKDSLKGICWYDDSQVVDERITKLYGEPKMVITVKEI